jgi:hypothetical protein
MESRLAHVAGEIMDKSQSSFMKNRLIKKGVSMSREVFVKSRKKIVCACFKVDFEKNCEHVNGSFCMM